MEKLKKLLQGYTALLRVLTRFKNSK
jgi:hypothetical protein